jgi:desulfoferrodoxin (superoxide reductase-like protein)
MRLMKKLLASLVLLLLVTALASPAIANRPAVTIKAPGTASAGETVSVDITVDHKGTTPSHLVDSIRLYEGDKLVNEWKYDRSNYVPQEIWTVTFPMKVDTGKTLNAIAHCNLHGDDTGTTTIAVN